MRQQALVRMGVADRGQDVIMARRTLGRAFFIVSTPCG